MNISSIEVARRLGVSPQTVREMARRGDLPSQQLRERGRFRFAEEDVEALVRRSRRG